MSSESIPSLKGEVPVEKSAKPSQTQSFTASDLEEWRASMQEIHDSGTNLPLAWRMKQVKAVRCLIQENVPLLVDAAKQDLNKHQTETVSCELEQVLGEIKYFEKNLAAFLKPQKLPSPGIFFPARTWVENRPLLGPGVLVIGPFNYPLSLVLQPAAAALAAGNPTIIKPSEHCPAIGEVLAKLIPMYFDSNVCRVVQGGVEETKLLLKYPWGKVFFTGSSAVGKLVAQQTALTLTPTLLELGGKCPAFVDGETSASFDWPLVAARIIWAKLLNCGQTCASVDYLIVDKKDVEKLLPRLVEAVEKQFGTDPYHSELGHIVTAKPHAQRQVQLLKELEEIASEHAKNKKMEKPCQIILGRSTDCRPEERYICPSIVLNPPLDSRIMQEEGFGPILPIVTVENRKEAIALMKLVESRAGTPLCLYVFAKSDKVFSEVTRACRSGSAMYNDCLVHLGNGLIPFGGLGTSGIGAYHGPHSLALFSHAFPYMHRPLIPGADFGGLRCHPFGSGFKQFLVEKVAIVLPSIPVTPEALKWMVMILVLVLVFRVPIPTTIIARALYPVVNYTANALEQLSEF